MNRRNFLGFFLISGLISMIVRKFGFSRGTGEKRAMFWTARSCASDDPRTLAAIQTKGRIEK